jgi:hypothetical protein
MMLRYDLNAKMIVMDNLSPSEYFFQNDLRYYGPDSSHNGLKFEKGKWIYYKEMDLRNPEMKIDNSKWIYHHDDWLNQDK